MKRIAAIVLLCVSSHAAGAQDGSYLVFDGGLSSCGKFLNASPVLAESYRQWTAGFMTGYSAATGSALGGVRDVDAIQETARRVCESDPTRAFGTAVREAVVHAAAR